MSEVSARHERNGLSDNPPLNYQFIVSSAVNCLERISALIIILLLSPLLCFIFVALRTDSAAPPLFLQTRLGRYGLPFTCLKFRTMRADAEAALISLLAQPVFAEQWQVNRKLIDDPRVTRLGRVLRRFSLDELPQLFNVVRGEMSLIGPRPIVPEEASRYGRHFQAYCKLRPGLTGLWQVERRNDSSYRRRVAADVLFVRSRSARLCLSILLRTVPAVLLGGEAVTASALTTQEGQRP